LFPPIDPNLKPVVGVFAHPDDELISGRGTLVRHRQRGHAVFVVIATDGVNSGVRSQLGMRPFAFADARYRETLAACRELGAILARPQFFVAEDGTLSHDQALHLWDWVTFTWPNASYKTHTYIPGGHPDHRALGAAAWELHQEGLMADVRFTVEPQREDTWAAPGRPKLMTDMAADVEAPGLHPVDAAVEQYQLVDPAAGRHGIAWQSTPDLLRLAAARRWTKYHAPTVALT
jgi:LmbE family N-acetylglucosaminyl deacetylase